MIPGLPTLAAYGRRMHRSTCVIERAVDGEGPFNPDTGEHDPAPPTELYAGSCHAAPTGGARVVTFGEGPVTLKTYDVELDGPVDGLAVGDRVRFVTSPDPTLVEADAVVLEVLKADTVTNRRIIVETAGG